VKAPLSEPASLAHAFASMFHAQPLFRAPSDAQSRSSSISSHLAFRHFSFLRLHAQMFAYFFLRHVFLCLTSAHFLRLLLHFSRLLLQEQSALFAAFLHTARLVMSEHAPRRSDGSAAARRRSCSSSNATCSVLVSDPSRPLSTDATPFFATASAADEAFG